MDRIVLTESWCDKKWNQMALRLRSHIHRELCGKWDTDDTEPNFLTYLQRAGVVNRTQIALDWLSYLQRAGVTKMALRLTVSPNRWCDKRNIDGTETDFLTFLSLEWQMENRWRWDWFSHLLSAGVTKGTQIALRLIFSPSERWWDKWNTDGAETDFLTF